METVKVPESVLHGWSYFFLRIKDLYLRASQKTPDDAFLVFLILSISA